VLTPLWGTVASVSVTKAVLAAAGEAPGPALVLGDAALARALAQHGFSVVLATVSVRARSRVEYLIVRARAHDLPIQKGSVAAVVHVGGGIELRGAAQDAQAAARAVAPWLWPLRPGGRLVLVDRIDGGILGARSSPSREDLCAALLHARLRDIAQVAPRAGTVVTQGVFPSG
jgi:hypothetical protein